jgi:hypothetical protein
MSNTNVIDKANKLNGVELLAMLIYTAVVVFATIMFLGMMANVFPDEGFLRIFAQAGAVAAGGTAILMPWAKRYWVAKGGMEVVTYMLWALEVVILVLNTMLAFDVANGSLATSWVGWWIHVSPASPLMSLITWGVLWVMHPHHRLRQAQMQFEQDFMSTYQHDMLRSLESEEVQATIHDLAHDAVRDRIRKDLKLPLDYRNRYPTGRRNRNGNPEPDEVFVYNSDTDGPKNG